MHVNRANLNHYFILEQLQKQYSVAISLTRVTAYVWDKEGNWSVVFLSFILKNLGKALKW